MFSDEVLPWLPLGATPGTAMSWDMAWFTVVFVAMSTLMRRCSSSGVDKQRNDKEATWEARLVDG
jgi:hypothetical protein